MHNILCLQQAELVEEKQPVMPERKGGLKTALNWTLRDLSTVPD